MNDVIDLCDSDHDDGENENNNNNNNNINNSKVYNDGNSNAPINLLTPKGRKGKVSLKTPPTIIEIMDDDFHCGQFDNACDEDHHGQFDNASEDEDEDDDNDNDRANYDGGEQDEEEKQQDPADFIHLEPPLKRRRLAENPSTTALVLAPEKPRASPESLPSAEPEAENKDKNSKQSTPKYPPVASRPAIAACWSSSFDSEDYQFDSNQNPRAYTTMSPEVEVLNIEEDSKLPAREKYPPTMAAVVAATATTAKTAATTTPINLYSDSETDSSDSDICFIQSPLEMIEDFFPDIDKTYAKLLLEQYGNNVQAVRSLISVTVDYPKRKDNTNTTTSANVARLPNIRRSARIAAKRKPGEESPTMIGIKRKRSTNKQKKSKKKMMKTAILETPTNPVYVNYFMTKSMKKRLNSLPLSPMDRLDVAKNLLIQNEFKVKKVLNVLDSMLTDNLHAPLDRSDALSHEDKQKIYKEARRPVDALHEERNHLLEQRRSCRCYEEKLAIRARIDELQTTLIPAAQETARNYVYERMNSAGGMGSENAQGDIQVDFHALHVKDAKLKFDEQVLPVLQAVKSITVVVGRGKHSHDGKAKLRPALKKHIEQHSQRRHLECAPVSGNPGAIKVTWKST